MEGLPLGRGGGLSAGRLRTWIIRWPAGIIALLVVALPGPVAAAAGPGAPPQVHGRSAAVLDTRDGAILWAENGHLRLPMASTTKMMTALVACQLLDDKVDTTMVVPPDVKQAYGELLYLRPGDTYTFLQLLEGMLLPSANDAAIAIAVNAAGSEPRFVQAMNAEAAALGLADTHFANPDGLEDPDHYSSAIDLARLGQAAMRDPIIQSVVRMPSATIPWPDHGTTRLVGNIDALSAYFPGTTGIKTGYTSEAQNVVVGSATRDGQSVVAVVMGEPAGPLWRDEENVLQYGLALAAARDPAAVDDTASAAAAGPARVGPAAAAPDRISATETGVAAAPGAAAARPISAVLLPAVPTPGGGRTTTVPAPSAVAAHGVGDPAPAAVPANPRVGAIGGLLALAALASGLVGRRGAATPRSPWRGRARQPGTGTAP